MTSRAAVVVSLVCVARIGFAQDPAQPDSARRDSLRRAPQTLPAMETKAPRNERVTFEQRPNVGTISITGRELTAAPRFFGEADVLRAVRLLPGVTARNDYSVGMNVRGGEADQNLVLLDGYAIYNPFHMGGLFGAFVEPMVDKVDFLTGAFPAMYGGRLSSVLDVHSAVEPRMEKVHGRADVSAIATTVALGRGLQGGRGTWTVAFRRTYADKVADLFGADLPYHFRDAQAHYVRVLPGDVRLSFTAYDNVDNLVQKNDDGSVTIEWGNRLFGATAARSFGAPKLFGRWVGDSLVAEQRLSWSRFDVNMNLFESALTLNNRVYDARAAGSLAAVGVRHTQTLGYETNLQRFTFAANYPLLLYPSDFVVNRNTPLAVYYDHMWRPSHAWIAQLGGRLDAVDVGDGRGMRAAVFQPRVSAKYFLSPDLALTAGMGTFAQSAHSLSREDVPIRALDFWVGSSAATPVSRAQHYVVGVERWLSPARALRVELFLKRYPSLVEQNPTSDPNVRGDEFLAVYGRSFGGDLMLRQFASKRFNGWLAYSFAKSTRFDANNAPFSPGQDRRHEMNFVGNWTGPRMTLSTRFNLATGTPYSVVTGQYDRRDYDPVRHTFNFTTMTQFVAGPRNAQRLPLSQRLDLSLTRNPRGTGVRWSPFLSVMNVYNARNVFAYLFDYTETPPKRLPLQQFPIFPTLGISIVW